MLPSIKTLATITDSPDAAKLLRKVLEDTTINRHTKLERANEILHTCGVERITGRNQSNPSIDYCNTGDSYGWTLMYVHFKGFRVGCWADIVERGNYE